MASLVEGVQNYASEPVTLFDFTNMVQWNSYSNPDNLDTFGTVWTAGWAADAKASFAWGLTKDINTTTGETEHLVWNPYADAYGYGYAYLNVQGQNA